MKYRIINRALVRFEVDDFRQFGNKAGFNVKFLNLFIGPNGSGKTTLLGLFRMIHSLVQRKSIDSISLDVLDRYKLITPKQRDFKIRMYFEDHIAIETQFSIQENLSWKRNQQSLIYWNNKTSSEILSESLNGEMNFDFKTFNKFLTNSEMYFGVFGLHDFSEVQKRTIKRLRKFIGIKKMDNPYDDNWTPSKERKYLNELVALIIRESLSDSFTWDPKCRDDLINNGLAEFYLQNDNKELIRDINTIPEFILRIYALTYFQWLKIESTSDQFISQDVGEVYDILRAKWKAAKSNSDVEQRFNISDSSVEQILYVVASIQVQNIGSKAMRSWITNIEDDSHTNEFIKLIESIHSGLDLFMDQLQVMYDGSTNFTYGTLTPSSMYQNDQNEHLSKMKGDILRVDSIGITSIFKETGNELRDIVLNHLSSNNELVLDAPEASLRLILTYSPKKFTIETYLTKNGQILPFAALSTGEDRMLLITLLQERSSFLEEPEANMHPDFQAKLGRRIVQRYLSECFEVMVHGLPSEPSFLDTAWANIRTRLDPSATTFIETHSEYLIRAIQLEIAKNLPSKEWLQKYGWDLEDHMKERLKDEPNIEVTYFDNSGKKVMPRSMGLRRDGIFRESFGKGFYDESASLAAQFMDQFKNN